MIAENNMCESKMIIDSGASSHMINDVSLFKTIDFNIKNKIRLGGEYYLWSEGKGDTEYLRNALYVPKLKFGLISVSKLDEDGLKSIFGNNRVEIKNKNNETILSGFQNKGLYYLDYVNKIKNKNSNHESRKSTSIINN